MIILAHTLQLKTLFIFQDNCLYSLIQDFDADGICDGPFGPSPFVPPKVTTCNFESFPNGTIIGIQTGTCSTKTEELLQSEDSREECGFVLRQQRTLIFETLRLMLQFMCNSEAVESLINRTDINGTNRLVPLEIVTEYDDATISTDLNFSK